MRPFTSTILFSDALKHVLDAATPIERRERVDLKDADGRVAAEDVVSTMDVPPFDRAAMDGYAVRAADTTGASPHSAVTLTCTARLFTGEVPSQAVGVGECIEIATGAPMPPGADAVVMVEETRARSESIEILSAVQPRQNVGARAADIANGRVVVAEGQTLNPSRVGALAAIGARFIDVYAKPAVAVMSTGNEITQPGLPLAPGQIYDVNRFTIETVVRRHGGIAHGLASPGDTLGALLDAFDNARTYDVIVFSGGSSVGDRDLMLDALRQRGQVIFHGIAVKPGKPTAFGRVGSSVVFGMPGYPTSCLSNAYMLLVPLLRRIARLPAWRPETIDLPLSRRIVSATGRHQFYTVRIVDGLAEPAFKSSGDITSMAEADGYIEIPAQIDTVDAGTIVRITRF